MIQAEFVAGLPQMEWSSNDVTEAGGSDMTVEMQHMLDREMEDARKIADPARRDDDDGDDDDDDDDDDDLEKT